MAEENLEDLKVAELQELAASRGVDVAKSATKAELIEALTPALAEESEEPVEEERVEPKPDPTEGADPVETLTVERGDQVALLTINDHRFVLSPTDVASARKALEVVGYELY